MSRSKPYQTLIFRCLHAGQGILALLGILTGYWLFNTWDHRFGHLPLPNATDAIIEFHEEIGGLFTGAIVVFIAYSLWAGHRRLVQPKSLGKLTKIGKPAWWYALHQFVNTGLLITGALVVLSGEEMSEDAMIGGHFSDFAYSLHIGAWAGMTLLTIFHLLLSVKIGGMPLLLSVVSLKVRAKDWPTYWPQRLINWWHKIQIKGLQR